MSPLDELNDNRHEVEKYKLEIQSHFETEFENRRKLYLVEDKIEILGFSLFKAECNLMTAIKKTKKHKTAMNQVDQYQKSM